MFLLDVEIAEFLKFNKIKALTETVGDIAKAVTGSELLQLSEDETKVKRKTDLQVKADADECTLYVESLPKSATHDYVKEIFSKYGVIVYVSLPRYKHSRRIKEFGFVEYESQEGVKKAVEAFKKWNGVLVYEDAEPEKLQSVVSFNEEQALGEEVKKEGSENDQSQNKATEEDESAEPPKKKLRTESECTENQENEANLNEVMDSETNEEPTEANKDSLEKKADTKTSQKKKKSKSATSAPEDKVFEMKIMPKREWKRLRNKYLNLQRTRFKEIKQKLQAGRKQQEKKQQKKKPPAPTPAKTPIKTASPRKINFYGALPFDRKSGSDDNIDDPVPPINPRKKPLFSFEPGLIVNIKFQEPLVDIKDFKQELKALTFIKYIDVKEGDSEAFVRVDKFASANQLVKYYTSSEYQTQILSGEVEQVYWQKMMSDREQKLNKTVKVKQVRGRQKLSKKIAQHIRFDE